MSVLNLGLAYMVFTAFALGLTFHWAPVPGEPEHLARRSHGSAPSC